MRYAIFTDIHANLEALEAVLAKIDKLAQEDPIDQIWFLGDLVGYGPNPNECVETLRARTNIIIAGNHDWAAVGKIAIEDFSEAARISARWTAEQLTPENYQFLVDLPESLEMDDCLLVHGSPFGPLWEYLTSEVLAERSFQCFTNRFCFVGHTHVPTIFQQPDTVANSPTIPLELGIAKKQAPDPAEDLADQDLVDDETEDEEEDDEYEDPDETTKMAAIRPKGQKSPSLVQAESVSEESPLSLIDSSSGEQDEEDDDEIDDEEDNVPEQITPEETILHAEERLNSEMEELLSLLGLSQSMITVTNEMIVPPIGDWQAPDGYRAIINPGGVGQPRDGDARAAFMIYDTESGFTFYRISYDVEKTQEKIVKANLPPYLATRLAYGR